ncbi:MAG: class I SAM-dependent DNA methyltransferase [Chloroflexota bacterium]
MADHQQISNFIWQVADLLRGPYRPPQYERVMLPMVVLRRFDCVLAATKAQVWDAYDKKYKHNERIQGEALDAILNNVAGQRFHNHSQLDFATLRSDPSNIAEHLTTYIESFSANVRTIFERFNFAVEIERLNDANLLYLIVTKFSEIDLHPDVVDNIQMGLLFENLIHRFNEAANETAGDYFTPREVIQMMVDLLLTPDNDLLTTKGKVFTLFDPTCGTGGMLSEAENHIRELNPSANLHVYGQDFNPRAYAIAASDQLMKGKQNSHIKFGDSLIDDQHKGEKFDYFLANPPFGVDWKRQQSEIKKEHKAQSGRFDAGLPRVNDGALLFLQPMVSKFEPVNEHIHDSGSRLAIVFNGSPLFTGGAGSGESDIRKWLIEDNDWLEAIIALPEQMFYNTGIGTYIWIVTNRKREERRGKVQLIDARERYQSMRRSMGDKRRLLTADDIRAIVCEYGNLAESATSKIFDNEEFGYQRVPIERPLRLVYEMSTERKSNFLDAEPHLLDDVQAIDRELGRTPRANWSEFDKLMNDLLKQRGSKWRKPALTRFRNVFTDVNPDAAPVVLKTRKPSDDPHARVWGWFAEGGREVLYEPDSQLRDFENVPLVRGEDGEASVVGYVNEQVIPHVADAWADQAKIRTGYEINFNRYFYSYTPPRSVSEIDADLKSLEQQIISLLGQTTG